MDKIKQVIAREKAMNNLDEENLNKGAKAHDVDDFEELVESEDIIQDEDYHMHRRIHARGQTSGKFIKKLEEALNG